MILQLPAITIPPGCEAQAANFLRGIRELSTFTARPEVVPDPAMRTVTTSFEHSIDTGIKQIEAKTALPA